MEIKAQLVKPYTEKQRIDFIVEYNHNKGYEIKETDVALQAWGETEEEILEAKRALKYAEANTKAKAFLESGEALYEFKEGKHVEATDGNIAKMTAYALAFVTGQLEPEATVVWNTKEDETVELTKEDIAAISVGLGEVQASVWAAQYPAYLMAIQEATTIEELDAIEIEYTSDVPMLEETTEEEVEE